MSRKTVTFDRNPLFGGPSLAERARTGSPFRYLPIADIDVDPEQPRRVFNDDSLTELSSSIAEYGVLCPVLVQMTAGGTYRLIAGERRLRASKLAGLESIPAIVDSNENEGADTLSKQLVENLQREELTPMERALAIGHLRDRFSLSIRDIAKRLGVSKGLVQRSFEVLSLPDDLQAALIGGAAETKVLVLAKVEDRAQRRKLLEQLDGKTREELEAEIGELLTQSGAQVYHRGTGKSRNNVSAEDARILTDLQGSLSTKVRLIRSRKDSERGRLTIEFYSNEELSEIYKRLT